MQQPPSGFTRPFLIAMCAVALILILSIALVITLDKYLAYRISIEQSLHYIFMLIGSFCLPWITQRFLHTPSSNGDVTASQAAPPSLPNNQHTRKIKFSFYLLAWIVFWGVFGPWSYFIASMGYLSDWLHSNSAILLLIAALTLVTTLVFAGLIQVYSRYILKIDSQQQDWRHWRLSLSFSFGLLCFAQLILNILMLKFLF